MSRRHGSPRGLPTPYWLGAAALLLGCGVLSLALMSGPVREWVLGPPIPTAAVSGLLSQATVPGDPAASCRQLIERAIQTSDESCSQIGSNKVCYGNTTLQARLAPGAAGRFEQKGDVIDVGVLQALSAAPMDLERQEWGIAIFKLLANLPRTLPGENVTFIVFGNTVLDNRGGNLEAFYFSSGAGRVACEAVPFDGILVEMPDGAGMTLAVNGAQVTLMGQAALQAAVNGSMTVSVLKGSARVSAAGGERFFGAGHQVSVPLAGVGGVEASGPPSEPQPLPEAVLQVSCTFTGSACSPADVTPVSPLEAQAAVYAAAGAAVPATQAAVLAATAATALPAGPGGGATPSRTPSLAPGVTPSSTPLAPNATALVTLTSTGVSSNTPTATQPGNSTSSATSPVTSTSTLRSTATNPPGRTPTVTSSSTLRSTGTSTATPTPTPSGTPTATNPSASTPTPTPTPSSTPTLPPTDTPTPVPTPTVEGCNISGGGLSASGLSLSMPVQNNMSSTVTISSVVIFWPETPPSQKLRDIYLDSQQIWSGNSNRSPSAIPAEGGWSGSDSDRQIGPGSGRTLRFEFHDPVQAAGNMATVTFGNGCAASGSN